MARLAGKLLSDTTGGMMLRVAVVLTVLLLSPLAVAAERVISLGGSVTEIVYALGEGDRLVADDASSLYPEAATRLPRVGYYRSLSLEGILSQQPDLLIASENAGPPEVLERLKAMGVPTIKVSDQPGIDSLYERVRDVARELGVPAAGDVLHARIQASLDTLAETQPRPHRALVVLHRGGPLLSAGADTSADALLRLSGMENVAGNVQGYKPMSAEALAALAPDLIFTSTMSAESAGGIAAFAAQPGVAATPAGKAGRVVAIDDLLLLGMGPRVAEAVAQLRGATH